MGVLVMAGGEGIWNTMELPPSRLAASKCPLDTCIKTFKSPLTLKSKMPIHLDGHFDFGGGEGI